MRAALISAVSEGRKEWTTPSRKAAGNPLSREHPPWQKSDFTISQIWPPPQSQLWKNQASGGQWDRKETPQAEPTQLCVSMPVNLHGCPPASSQATGTHLRSSKAQPWCCCWGHSGTAQAQAVDRVFMPLGKLSPEDTRAGGRKLLPSEKVAEGCREGALSTLAAGKTEKPGHMDLGAEQRMHEDWPGLWAYGLRLTCVLALALTEAIGTQLVS